MQNQKHVRQIASIILMLLTSTCYGIYLHTTKGYGLFEVLAAIITIMALVLGCGLVSVIVFALIIFLERLFKRK